MAPSHRLLLLSLVVSSHHFLLFGPSSATNAYIVYMGHKKPQDDTQPHHGILSSALGLTEEAAVSSILYSYNRGFSGFAALMTEPQASLVADFPGVARVIPNRIHGLHTTRSWDFLKMDPRLSDGLLSRSRSGDGSIIGVLDTGIWPESASFDDRGMGQVPARWRGTCQQGHRFDVSHCNRKIIGARWYVKGYEAEFGRLNTSDTAEFLSARDASGHGTHTSSTAAGASVGNASFMGLAGGVARGGAPGAMVAAYKVCWATGGCSSADILAAFDDAIHDGVDVLSVSLGSPPPLAAYVDDVLAVGSFHAVGRGISVVCSAGNSGPYAQTVINTAPWVVSVAASTIDRAFLASVTLGNNRTLMGQSFYGGKDVSRFRGMVYAEDIASVHSEADDARGCDVGSLNATLARGKVVLCFQTRGQRSAAVAARTVSRARGAGLVFAQFLTKDVAPVFDLPFIQLDVEAGTSVLAYIERTRSPVVKFGRPKTAVGAVLSPEVAYFSSRGPSSLSPYVLKPDVAAPGVNILASWSAASPLLPNTPAPEFMIESGTSMSCPHVSAIVALLKSAHPSWSPAAIKSALVTTASVRDGYGLGLVAEGAPYKQADPFDYGGGHVDPNRAADPGLVFDMGVSDHTTFLCSMGYNNSAVSFMAGRPAPCHDAAPESQKDLNLPSISIPALLKRTTVTRTATNVGFVGSVYAARVEAPPGVEVRVKPPVMSFNSSVTRLSFRVVVSSRLRVEGRYSFGSLSWEDGVHVVRIPIAVRPAVDKLLGGR